jgi:hypothetical protein
MALAKLSSVHAGQADIGEQQSIAGVHSSLRSATPNARARDAEVPPTPDGTATTGCEMTLPEEVQPQVRSRLRSGRSR